MKATNSASIIILQKLYKSQKGADVEFVFKSNVSDCKLKVPAHKAILAAASPVFDSMFYGDLKEGAEVTMTDASYEAFCEFLQIFYLGEIDLSEENIAEVFQLMDKYDVQGGMAACEYLLKETVTTELTCLYYEMALDFNSSDDLVNCFANIISNETISILKTDSFKSCSHIVLKKILERDYLECSETDIFAAIICWATKSCENKNLPASPENMKVVLGECLALVRFPTMTVKEFANCLERYPQLLDYNVYHDILHYTLDKRSMTSASYFNIKPRISNSKEINLSFWSEDLFLSETSEADTSIISFTATKDVWLNFFDIIIPTEVAKSYVKIRIDLNGVRTQEYTETTVMELGNSSSSVNYDLYRLNLREPLFCGKDKSNETKLELHWEFTKHSQLKKIDMIQMNGIDFKFNNENYFLKQLNFTDKLNSK